MKNLKEQTKRVGFLAIASMGILSFTSCDNGHEGDTKEMAEGQNDDRIDEKKSKKDAEFLVDAASIHLEEIKLGELAQQNATMNDVKDLAKMMVAEHSSSLNDLKGLASKKSVTIPSGLTEEGQEAWDKLNEKSGNDFNKAYCEMMVKGHKDAINRFEWAASNATDLDIRNWASSMLPALNEHLDQSNICLEKCKAAK